MKRLFLKSAPILISALYGASVVLTFLQYHAGDVGVEASIFRFIAWQVVFAFVIMQSENINQTMERIEQLEKENEELKK